MQRHAQGKRTTNKPRNERNRQGIGSIESETKELGNNNVSPTSSLDHFALTHLDRPRSMLTQRPVKMEDYMSASTSPSLLRLAVPNSKRCEGAHGTALVTISLNGGTAAKTHWYGMHAPMYLSSMHPVVHPSPSSTHMGCVAVRAKARHESYPVLPADGSVFPLQQHVRARQSKLTLLLDPVVAGVWGGVRWGE